jgi:hypothetical protein
MEIKVLKYHCHNDDDLNKLAFFTELKYLCLRLHMYIKYDLVSIIKNINLPCNLEHIYILHEFDEELKYYELEQYTKTIHENIKLPYNCILTIIFLSEKDNTACEINDEYNYYENLYEIKKKFLDKVYECDEDSVFVIKNHLTLSQLLKIQKLIELKNI